jgi:hypothetical protein
MPGPFSCAHGRDLDSGCPDCVDSHRRAHGFLAKIRLVAEPDPRDAELSTLRAALATATADADRFAAARDAARADVARCADAAGYRRGPRAGDTYESTAIEIADVIRSQRERLAMAERERDALENRDDHEYSVEWHDDATGECLGSSVRNAPRCRVEAARELGTVAIRVRDFFRLVTRWQLRKERDAAIAERDSRPNISAEDCAILLSDELQSGEDDDFDADEEFREAEFRVNEAIRTHATKRRTESET